MRIYAAMAQQERELISERTKATLAADKVRGARLGGDSSYGPADGPETVRRQQRSRSVATERAAHRLLLEVEGMRVAGIASPQGIARARTERSCSDTWSSRRADSEHTEEEFG